ncbi:amino acid adenylation domain-containing protein [Streptacidiphilus sp. BW17]|uniref:amino acid adenylation domain-containing protein n=1 Tax=Streptacidiphilus sp. BW17 TaxID=3156274 RepID=UPI003513D216
MTDLLAPLPAPPDLPSPAPLSRTLFDWFAETAAVHPDEPALEVLGRCHSYRELEDRAAAVACALLRANGGTAPKRVALLASRSLTAFAGYLAALRLGATVTPLNPGYPVTRNRSVWQLAASDVLLADETGAAQLSGEDFSGGPALLRLTGAETAQLRSDTAALPAFGTTPADVAYILFTSGSTGRPKGVPIRHANLAPYIAHNIERFEVGPRCRVSHTFDLTFDPSVFDLFVTWGGGATLVVPQRSELMKPVQYVADRGITHWFSVPSVVSVSASLGTLPADGAPALRHAVFIGEQLTERQARLWAAAAPDAVVTNVYGPTELTVACSEFQLPRNVSEWAPTSNDTVPIGAVYPFLDHVVLGEDGLPAEEGELCVRGPQRFDGYLDPSDDHGRFLSYEPDDEPHRGPDRGSDRGRPARIYRGDGPLTAAYWYRTGDRVRHEHGSLVHLGRLDSQVKIRGYRVELGEIETALRRHPAMAEAVVLAVPGSDGTELTACHTGDPVTATEVMLWLRKRIPVHMVPRRYEHLDALPLNANGKIDRPALVRRFTPGRAEGNG